MLRCGSGLFYLSADAKLVRRVQCAAGLGPASGPPLLFLVWNAHDSGCALDGRVGCLAVLLGARADWWPIARVDRGGVIGRHWPHFEIFDRVARDGGLRVHAARSAVASLAAPLGTLCRTAD